MKRLLPQLLALLVAGLLSIQTASAQCYQLGTTVTALPTLLKTTSGFCPSTAQAGPVCDCPAGFVAVGYQGQFGNTYGATVLSQYSLRCRQLNTDGTLGAAVTVTCSNGTAAGTTTPAAIDATASHALVGAQVRLGCALDGLTGRSKLLSEVHAVGSNATNTSMAMLGGTGGTQQAVQLAPDGHVLVGMQTFAEPGPNPAAAIGIVAGVAWRYRQVQNVACPASCSISSITVSNISACNNNGTPGNTADDTFTANVGITFMAPPASGNLVLSGDGSASIAVGSLVGASHTFTGVTMSADGSAINLTASFSAAAGCTLNNSNAGTAPASCSVVLPCSISGISVANISTCNNAGTPSNTADDIYTANVTVTFANPPASGNLVLTGSGAATVGVGSLVGNSHTFNGVTMLANGQAIALSASFSAAPTCNFSNNNAGTAPASCSLGAATVPTMSEWGLILFALIIFTMTVVMGTQQQHKLAMSGETTSSVRQGSTFDKSLYLKVLPLVWLSIAALFGVAMSFGYELTNADVPGSLLSGLVIAYLVQFVMKSSKKG